MVASCAVSARELFRLVLVSIMLVLMLFCDFASFNETPPTPLFSPLVAQADERKDQHDSARAGLSDGQASKKLVAMPARSILNGESIDLM